MSLETPHSAPVRLGAALRQHRRGLALTWTLTAAETGFDLLYPFAIGVAINGLLQQHWLALLPLAGIWLAHTASGYVRQRLDTRLYTRIHRRMASDVAVRQRAAGVSTSEVSARIGLIEELVEALEYDLPLAAMAAFGLIGGGVMLCFYDLLAGLLMSTTLIPAAFIYWRFARRAQRMECAFNDRSEQEVAHIDRGDGPGLRRHFRHLSRWRVLISDAEAGSWSRVELLSLGLFAAMLVRLTQQPDLQAGDIFAAVAYAVGMLDALDTVPDRVASVSRVLDTLKRLRDPDEKVLDPS